ncbi:MAG: hypothetical protein GY860_16940 [Desulfobacteraceae bacterium]|nr:hypothetical protein [Desulfobacteraceae bacterium]
MYKILCSHDARTLDPDCSDYRKLDLMLDDLWFMLMKIKDGKGDYPGNRIILKLRPGDPGRVPH